MAKRKPVILAIDFDEFNRPSKSASTEFRGGLCTFIGWRRMVEEMKQVGTVRECEMVLRFEISEDGIQIMLSTTAQA